MGQHPSKGGSTQAKTPTKVKPSDKAMFQQVLAQQERQREAQRKQQERAKQLNEKNQSELQRSVMSARHEETPLLALSKSTGFSLLLLRRLEVLFDIISGAITRDNAIDGDELSAALGLSQSSFLFLAIFKLFDATSTHRVNFRTWVLTLYNLSPQATFDQKARFSFSLLDLNGDGSIESEELVNLVKNVIQLSSRDPSHPEQDISNISENDIRVMVQGAFHQADSNGDGSISYDEYLQLMRGSKHFYRAFTLDIDYLCAAFTTPEVQQAVLLSNDEAIRRTKAFQAKKYQHMIRESFSAHVVPMMQQRLSRAESMTSKHSFSHVAMPGSTPTPTPTPTPTTIAGSPQTETLDSSQWDTFERVTKSPSSNNPQGIISGTIADLVRMRTMSGLKNSAIVPAITVIGVDSGAIFHEEWQLVDDLAPTTNETPTTSYSNSPVQQKQHQPHHTHTQSQPHVPMSDPQVKPIPRISLSLDPQLDRKYSISSPRYSLADQNSTDSNTNTNTNTNTPRGPTTGTNPHGKLLRERSDRTLVRESLPSRSLLPSTSGEFQCSLQTSCQSSPPTPLQIGQLSSSPITRSHSSSSTTTTPPASPRLNLDLTNLPPILPQPISSTPSQSMIDLTTISEDTTRAPTPPVEIRTIQPMIVYADGTKVPVKHIIRLEDLDIEVEVAETEFVMEQSAPALARLLAAMRDDAQWQ